ISYIWSRLGTPFGILLLDAVAARRILFVELGMLFLGLLSGRGALGVLGIGRTVFRPFFARALLQIFRRRLLALGCLLGPGVTALLRRQLLLGLGRAGIGFLGAGRFPVFLARSLFLFRVGRIVGGFARPAYVGLVPCFVLAAPLLLRFFIRAR